MVFFNYTTMQMTAKIVYYGPGLCGKTTNLQAIHHKTAPQSRGEMVSLETETDRTLFFDLLPLDVGVIGGMKVRLQLYTVPGQVFYNATRKLVLKSVDGIVFVADSQSAALDANVESLQNLKVNLSELGLSLDSVPLVLQYNKRDIRNILGVDELNRVLNPIGVPHFEAAALHGIGVFETLKAISRLAISFIRKKLADEPGQKPSAAPTRAPTVAATTSAAATTAAAAPPVPVAAPATAPAAPRPAAAVPARVPEAANPLAALVPDAPHAEEVPVEFASEDTDKHVVPVKTKGHVDIQQELEKLRAVTASASAKPAGGASKDIERRLQDILVPEQTARQEVRRKASVEVPGRLLKGSSAMKIRLGFEGDGEEWLRDAVTVKLVGNRRLERLTLYIELDIKGKS